MVSSLTDTLIGETIEGGGGARRGTGFTEAVGSTAANIISRTLNGIVSQTIVTQFTGGKLNYANIVTDAFGNMLGNEIGRSINSSLTADQQEGQLVSAEQEAAQPEVTELQRQQAMAAYGMNGGNGSNTSNGAAFQASIAAQDQEMQALFGVRNGVGLGAGAGAGGSGYGGSNGGNGYTNNSNFYDDTADPYLSYLVKPEDNVNINRQATLAHGTSFTDDEGGLSINITTLSNASKERLQIQSVQEITDGVGQSDATMGDYLNNISRFNATYGLGYDIRTPGAAALTTFAPSTAETLITQGVGGAVGALGSVVEGAIGLGHTIYNGALSDLNQRSDGLLGSFIPHVAQADAAHRQLQQTLYNAARSPLNTLGNIVTSFADREAQAQLLEAQEQTFGAARLRGGMSADLTMAATGVMGMTRAGVGLAGRVGDLRGYTPGVGVSSTRAVDGLNLNVRPTATSFEGTITRLENPARVDTTFDVHAGNVAADHRYSGPGNGAIYGATAPETAFAEMDHYGLTSGRVYASQDVKFSNVLDLTSPTVQKQLNFSLNQITGDSYLVTHQLGDFARTSGYDALLAPSARNLGGTNLVIFPKVK